MVNWKEQALEKQDFVIDDLKQLISIPSVLDEGLSREEAPFGPSQSVRWIGF
ncbi:hypothetical protein [Sporosarcina thermotolerans]|uniref:hypothetical protein n=1 Tax=Sporosarcina thermotolerans TaxID=633404 RepID=UPI00321912EA